MSYQISAFGIGVYLSASKTYPVGLFIDAFADDEDAVAFTRNEVGGSQMDLNGKLLAWSSANPIELTIGVIPHSAADKTLAVLLAANRPANFTTEANDRITLIVNYPDRTIRTFTGGCVIGGQSGASARSAGRLASNTYTFHFADMTTIDVATAVNSLFRDFGLDDTLGGIV